MDKSSKFPEKPWEGPMRETLWSEYQSSLKNQLMKKSNKNCKLHKSWLFNRNSILRVKLAFSSQLPTINFPNLFFNSSLKFFVFYLSNCIHLHLLFCFYIFLSWFFFFLFMMLFLWPPTLLLFLPYIELNKFYLVPSFPVVLGNWILFF